MKKYLLFVSLLLSCFFTITANALPPISGGSFTAADNATTATGTSTTTAVTPAGLHYLMQHLTAVTASGLGTFGTLSAGTGGFTVDADGDVTAKSYSTTRGDAAQYVRLYEATSDGNNYADLTIAAKGTGLSGDRTLTIPDATGTVALTGAASMITRYQYIPAGYMEDAAASPCAAAAVISGEETKARLCDDNESVIISWQVDPEWSAGFKFRVYYALVSDASADNTVTFRLQGCTIGNSEALTCSAGDLVSVDDELGTDDDANQLMISDWSGAVTLTGIAAGELSRLTLLRGTDDYAAEVNVIGIEIKYQAKLSAASDY